MSRVILPAICHEYGHRGKFQKIPSRDKEINRVNVSPRKREGTRQAKTTTGNPRTMRGHLLHQTHLGSLQSSEATQLDSNENQTGEDEGIPEKEPIEEGIKYKS